MKLQTHTHGEPCWHRVSHTLISLTSGWSEVRGRGTLSWNIDVLNCAEMEISMALFISFTGLQSGYCLTFSNCFYATKCPFNYLQLLNYITFLYILCIWPKPLVYSWSILIFLLLEIYFINNPDLSFISHFFF